MYDKTSKISLRTPLPEDLQLMLEIENNPENRLFSRLEHRVFSEDEILSFILSNHDLKTYGQIRYTVVTENNPIGFFDLYDVDFVALKAGIGIIVHPAYQHRGFGTLALTKLESIARIEHGLKKLYAVVDKNNTIALSFFKKMAYRSAIPKSDVQIFPNSVYFEKIL